MKITIFTPTYNRAGTLPTLYKSILRQTFTDFEWIIVDDGSTDTTSDLVQSFMDEVKMTILYFKKENGGKHRAVNFGAKQAKGELFFVVDSDDYLADNALERLWFHYKNIENDPKFAGVCGLRPFSNGVKFEDIRWQTLDCTPFDAHHKYNLWGEKAEAYKTNIIKENPYPEFEGEKFAIEITGIEFKYLLRYFNENIVFGEYLEDGLTRNLPLLRRNNPMFFTWLYAGETYYPVKFGKRLRSCVEFWLYYRVHKSLIKERKLKFLLPLWAYLIYPMVVLSGKKLKY